MAEALGVAASIIAVLQLSGVMINYLKDVKDASKDCQNILLEIGSTRCLLQVLNDLIAGSNTQGSYLAAARSLAVQYGPLDQFRSALERLSEKIITPANGFSKTAKILTWTLKNNDVKELLSTIERIKSLLSLALQNDHLSLSRSIEADVVEIKRGILLQAQQSRDTKYLDILRWLAFSKPEEAHLRVRERRLPGTGTWLLENLKFIAWRDQEQTNSVLWCHGIPGAGKTVLSSLVIDHLNDKFINQNVSTVFFYCDFSDPQSQSAVNIVASLLKQCALVNPSVMESVTTLYEKHMKGSTYPHVSELEAVFLSSIQDFRRTFLVLDALDECDTDISREPVLKVLKNFKTSSLRIFVTSRPHPDDIKGLFQDSPQVTIEASSEDIEQYVRAAIKDSGKAARIMGSDFADEAISKITDNAQGMFLLPRLQIQTILGKKNKRDMREALQSLPSSLDEKFHDTLDRIRRQSEESVRLAMETMEWIFRAKRPLLVQELNQGLSIRINDSSLDEEGYSLPEDMVEACLGLVSMNEVEGTIRFVHFTVQEYLSKTAEVFPSQGSQLTSACLTFLLFDEFKRGPCPSNESFEIRQHDYPFFDYASNYWGFHLKESPTEANDTLAITLLKTNSCVLSIVQHIHRDSYGDYSQRYPKLGSLQLAASLGLDIQVKALLDSGADVDVVDEKEGSALHLAIKGSHDSTVSLLLQHGVDRSLLDEDRSTALHLAAEAGSIAMTTLLCDAKADLLAIDGFGKTALHRAVENKHTNVCMFLIERGMNVASEDRFGSSILHEAAETGDVDLVKCILEHGANVSTVNDSRETAMHRAAWNGHENVVCTLHQYGCDIDSVDEGGGSPLHRAACCGHTETMRFLLEKGADPKRVDNSRTSALHEAAESGSAASIQLLLDYGADINTRGEINETVIHRAARNRDTAVLPLLVEKGAILDQAKNDFGHTPLYEAASAGIEDNVRYLVENGADIEMPDDDGSTALFGALGTDHESTITFLIDKGADTTKIGWNGNTMLHQAAESSSVAMLRLLIQKGADINSTNKEKRTALHMRTQNTEIEGAQFLITSGVDINARNSWGATVLHEALEYGNDNLTLLLISEGADVLAKANNGNSAFHFAAMGTYKQSIFDLLLDKGVGFDAQNNDSKTPLLCAAEHDNSALIRFLVQHGADVTAVTKSRLTALHLLAETDGNSESAKLLIDHGVDPKARTSSGATVLHRAFSYACENKPLIQLLVEKGADINATYNEGITVLHLAAKNSSAAIVRYLIERGANVMAKTSKGTSVLHFTTENEDPERIIMAVVEKGADIEERDLNGRTSLLRAGLEYGCRLLVKYLVDKGANVLAHSKVGNTILHQPEVIKDIELVKYLIDKGARVPAVNIAGVSVLHVAIEQGAEQTVQMLVERGANSNFADKKGVSALHRAVKVGNLAVVRFLLEKGAKITAKDKTGLTALHLAVENQHETVVQLLIEKGADINASTLDGVSVLHKAVAAELLSVVHNLIEKGVQINAADNLGVTALHRAVKGNHAAVAKIAEKTRPHIEMKESSGWKAFVEEERKRIDLAMVYLLLEHGADVNAQDKRGVTALKIASDNGLDLIIQLLYDNGINKTSLFSAAERGHEAEVRLLLSKGADADLESPDHHTPLWYAIKNGHSTIVSILLDSGANFQAIDRNEESPLSFAACKGNEAIVKQLLDKDADMEVMTVFDLTVLEFAMEVDQKAVLDLLDAGTASELKEITYNGLRPLSMATGNGHEAVVKLLLEKEVEICCSKSDRISILMAAWNGTVGILELLLHRENNSSLKTNFGQALLWLAVFRGNEVATKLLLEKGADIRFKYEGEQTLLSCAADRKNKDMVELLLKNGVGSGSSNITSLK